MALVKAGADVRCKDIEGYVVPLNRHSAKADGRSTRV
jgi:hypothetical protein